MISELASALVPCSQGLATPLAGSITVNASLVRELESTRRLPLKAIEERKERDLKRVVGRATTAGGTDGGDDGNDISPVPRGRF